MGEGSRVEAARQRAEVEMLVREDLPRARKQAEAIAEPLYRAQALASVARFGSDHHLGEVVRLALAAASDCEDAYDQVVASAWPLRALMERGLQDEALTMMEVVLHAVPRITRAAGRSEALLLLLQAMFEAGEELRRSMVFAISELVDADPHWRVLRNYRTALLLCRDADPDFVHKMARLEDAKEQRKLERELAGEAMSPRIFFS